MKSKEDLLKEYQDRKPKAGVLQIENLQSGRILIEATSNIPARINRHRAELRFGTHRNHDLQRDWNTLGEESFEFTILSEVKIKDNYNVLYLDGDARRLLSIIEESRDLQDIERYV